MKRVSMFAAFALSFSIMASLLVSQAGAWFWLPWWEREWAGGSMESAWDVAVAADGSVYTVGSTSNFSTGGPWVDNDALILKYSATGTLLWARTWGGNMSDEAFGVAYVPFGEFVCVVGRTWSFGQGGSDAFILEFSSGGNLLWARTWGGTNNDEALDVAVHLSGRIYVVGHTWSFGVYDDAFILGFASNGFLLLQQTWGGGDRDVAEALAVTKSAVYVVGYTCSFGAPWVYDAFIVKYNLVGGLLWRWTWGGTNDEAAHGVAVDSIGKYIYVVGMTMSYGAGGFEAFILKLDSTGTLHWDATWGGPNADIAVGVAVYGTTDIYVVGETYNFSPTTVTPAAFALHVDSTGALIDEAAWAGSSGVASVTDVAVSPKPIVYISGYANCPAPFTYMTTPVGGSFVVPVWGTLAPVTGSVTIPSAGQPVQGNVGFPWGSPTYLPWLDATLISIWP